MKKSYVKALALLLAIIMMLGVAPLGVFAETIISALSAEEPVYVLAGSDFQPNSDNQTTGRNQVNAIINQIKAAGYDRMDGFLFAGDYSKNGYVESTTNTGLATLKDTIQTAYGTSVDQVYIQGNHDLDSSVDDGTLAPSGDNDTKDYGVFVINEKDYMWKNDTKSTIQTTADNLKAYLDAKVEAEYDKPIFVISHLPLHYTMRTNRDGDGRYADLLFNVLNNAGKAGLNIIFLYGHDHSHGWDDYVGGAAVYLPVGDKINIAQSSKTSFKEETLAFTYMNAGFVGYYADEDKTGIDCALTMTVFVITDGQVEIKRFSSDGLHNLKSKGMLGCEYNDAYGKDESTHYAANQTVYTSPQYITWEVEKPLTVTDATGTVTVTAPDITAVTASKTEQAKDGYAKYVVYDINVDGYTQGNEATVTIKLDNGFVSGVPVTVFDVAEGTSVVKEIVDGTVTFTTNHFSEFAVGQADLSEPVTDTVILPAGTSSGSQNATVDLPGQASVGGTETATVTISGKTTYTPVTSLTNNTKYVIRTQVGEGYKYLTSTLSNSQLQLSDSADQAATWTYSYRNGNRALKISGDNGDKYLKITASNKGNSGTISLEGSSAYLQINNVQSRGKNTTNWNIGNSSASRYMNANDSKTSVAKQASTNWQFCTITETPSTNVTLTVDHKSATLKAGGTLKLNATVTGGSYAVTWSSDSSVVTVNDGTVTAVKAGTAKITAKLDGVDGVAVVIHVTVLPAKASLSVTPGEVFLNTNGTVTLSPSVSVDGTAANTYTITWESDDPSIVSVSNGKLTAHGEGDAKITATLVTVNGTTLADQPEVVIPVTVKDVPVTLTVAPGTVSMRPDSTFSLVPSVLYDGKASSNYTINWSSSDSSIVSVSNGKLTAHGEGTVTVTATLTAADGKDLTDRPQVKITVYSQYKQVVSATIAPESGVVNYGAKTTATTGSVITVTYDDGTIDKVPVTVSMLEGDFNLRKTGVYEGLTVTYGGMTLTESFALTVTAVDYPHYPNEGAVRVNKTATGIDFQASGLAQVELSATGVPVKKGADVIVMLDMSSSMTNSVDGVSRLNVLKSALRNLITQFQGTDAMGDPYDIRLAIADFNGYYTSSSSPYYLDSKDHPTGGSIRTNTAGPDIYTGTKALDAGAFVDVNALNGTTITNSLNTGSGTNYDYAFDAVYQLGSAITAANEEAGEERDLYVIFMSDGAPFQYNYFSSQSGTEGATTAASYWNNWLQGTITSGMLPSNSHTNFYNDEGKHWMAEAIKGDPAEDYQVIRKNVSKDGFTTVKGLGATMYSIGFCLERDKEITVASMEHVLLGIASSPAMYHNVNSADGLTNAFSAIGTEIAYAASEARFVDTMGSHFDLKLGNHTYKVIENGMEVTKTFIPDIVVRAYDIYTKDDVNGTTVTEDMIGVRKGTSNVLETVTFNAAGTEVYSTAVSGNILKNDVIYAKTFFYNTTATAVMIDTNGDGTTDYSLAPETFYWKMGTVNTTELALSYYVYLTGALEGKAAEGSYETNESAILYYKNWVGNDCQMPTVSPLMPWGSANVSYGFYLVNEYGQPINAKREVVSFANRVIVIPAALYAKINLNNAQEINALNVTAGHVLPQGCELYDADASYLVEIHSAGGGKWEITKGDGLANTTYVTGFSGDTFSNALTENSVSTDYTHTTVWFAVKFDAKTTDDAVVIDYGSPVDVDILSNDIFYNVGTLEGISLNGGEFGTQYGKTAEGKFGTFEIVGGKLRYTPTTMGMTEPEEIYYAVYFHSNEEFSGYFYGKLTVIPATIMYFEDSFVKYVDSTAAADGSDMGKWAPVGQDMPIIQAEDRIGIANNVYGYDPMNNGFTTYSSGSAMSVTVDAATATPNNDYKNSAHATFTFTGTGFDIISLTNSTTDMILITVEKDGVELVNTMVDNYYGYTYSAEDDVWTATPSDEAVWQVPVIKIDMADKVEEAYGTYTVNIYVYHHMFLDHDDSGSCTFILDAIRIYNPAKGNADAENAYKADGEYNPTYTVVKDLILAADNLTDANTINGVVFIDGKNATDKVADYTNPGPNYETYLANEQSVSFKLTADAIPASVQIGAKLAFGAKATLAMGMLKDGKEVIKYVDLNTATDMYYVLLTEKDWHLTEDGTYVTDTITLANSSEGAVISLTNLKFTQSTADEKAAVNAIVDEAVVADAGVMMFSLFRAPVIEETEPETEAPTEPETEAPTEPETEAPTEPETETPTEPETEAPTEAPTDEVTEAPETNAPEQGGDATQAPDGEQTTAPAKEGCGSVIGFSAIAILAAAAAVVALKKD